MVIDAEDYVVELERTANFLRGILFDKSIQGDVREAIESRIIRLDDIAVEYQRELEKEDL